MSTMQQEMPLDYRAFCSCCPGICCYRLAGATLYLDAADINRLARHFKISDGEVRKRFMEGRNTFKTRADGSCIFLLNGRLSERCGVHEARPTQCRNFPYGQPCPYLHRADLLKQIFPRVKKSLQVKSEESSWTSHFSADALDE